MHIGQRAHSVRRDVRGDSTVCIRAPLGILVPVMRESWEIVATVKHPVMAGREGSGNVTLEDDEAFLVTAYPTDAIKEGVRICGAKRGRRSIGRFLNGSQ